MVDATAPCSHAPRTRRSRGTIRRRMRKSSRCEPRGGRSAIIGCRAACCTSRSSRARCASGRSVHARIARVVFAARGSEDRARAARCSTSRASAKLNHRIDGDGRRIGGGECRAAEAVLRGAARTATRASRPARPALGGTNSCDVQRLVAIDPHQDLVVAAHVVDVRHGGLARRETALHAAEPLLCRSAAAAARALRPSCRDRRLAICVKDARVLEMAEAQVVRGDREPGAIGLADALGNLAPRA